MNEFFKEVEKILFSANIEEKFTLFQNFYSDFLEEKFFINHHYNPKNQTQPSYAKFCNIVHPTKISRPKVLHSSQNLAKIIHSLAHIEYSAIDLALDATYKFQNLPVRYYKDWLEVANEEMRHFQALREILNDLGFEYGDFDVHNNLYEAMILTSSCISDRMGLVHRGLEAMGLDANPFVIAKIQTTTHPIKSKIIQTLQIILNDEISHVHKGDKWWKYTNVSNAPFSSFIKRFENFSIVGKVPNLNARLQAGFTQMEVEEMLNISREKRV